MPVYCMVENNLDPRCSWQRYGGWRRERPRREPLQYRERCQADSSTRPTMATEPLQKPVQDTPLQEEELTEVPKETQDRYEAFMQAAEETTKANLTNLMVQVTQGLEASQSEDEGDNHGTKEEGTDSDSDSQHSICWKRTKDNNVDLSSPLTLEKEENMDHQAMESARNRHNPVEEQTPDPVADAIPVLEKTNRTATGGYSGVVQPEGGLCYIDPGA